MAPVQFGNYQILRKIGAGGMAQVFEAQRLGLEGFSRKVALKCILPEMTRDQRFVEMFVNEARLGSQLHHPNIIEIQDFNKVNDIYYIAMEFVEGVDLSEIIRRYREQEREFPPGLAIDIMLQTLDGLGYAHEAIAHDGRRMQIIHRDIKPSNLLLTRRGTVKIADFGIAKAATNAYQTRTADITKGSLAYMAPEQITREADVSPASDLFSLGTVLFEMLSLRALFDGENMPSIMFKVAQVEIGRDLVELEAVRPEFVPILRRVLARDVDARYPNAAAMAADLRPLRERYPAEPTISDIASTMLSMAQVDEADGWVGEHTANILGFTPYSTSAMPNLADLGGGHTASHPSVELPISMGQATAVANPFGMAQSSMPNIPVPEQHQAPPPPPVPVEVTRPANRRGMLIGIGVLALLIGMGGAWLSGIFNTESRIDISSMPNGARVLINGELQTQTSNGHIGPRLTPTILGLPKGGSAAIEVVLDGYEPFSGQVTYQDGETVKLNAELKPASRFGTLEVTSTPPGAAISIDGKAIGQVTPFTVEKLEANKRYEVQLTLDGYTPVSGQVEVRDNGPAIFSSSLVKDRPVPTPEPAPAAQTPRPQPTPATARPERSTPAPVSEPARQEVQEPGVLIVSAVPPDCVVYVDGKRRGNAPQKMSLSPGNHKVRLERFDGGTATQFTVSIASHQEVTRVWDLEAGAFIEE